MTTTTVAAATMKVAQISKPGAGFQIVEREIPEPQAGQVRIKVQACRVCHSTLRFAELTGVRPMIEAYPLENADEAYAE
jgi:D-arabinose 1-dehydrogenase-like Zn-dependent alcohol dehydrogenase